MNDTMLLITNEAEHNEINNKVKIIIGETNENSKKTNNLLDHMRDNNNAITDDTFLMSSDIM